MDDPAGFVGDAITTAPYRHHAAIVFHTSVDELRRRIPPTVGTITDHERGALLTLGADDLDSLLGHLVMTGMSYEVLEPDELRTRAARVGRMLARNHTQARRRSPS